MTSFQKVMVSLMALLELSSGRQKICRLMQYVTKYMSSVYIERRDLQPHLRNQLEPKIKSAQVMSACMGMGRKVLRFGPSIATFKTFITNINALIKGQNKESTPIFFLRTLSALWIAGYYICDHYLWLTKMGLAKDKNWLAKMDYLSTLSWFLDCWTGLINNFLIYSQLSPSERKKQRVRIAADTLRCLLDLPLAWGFLNPGWLSGKGIGSIGTITSLLGLFLLWK